MIPVQEDRRATIDAARANRRALARAQANDLQFAAAIADLYSTLDDPSGVLPGSERLVQFGADGTPAVAEFCTLEIAAAFGVSDESATALVADALDVRHRLPGIWRLVDELKVPVWQARKLAVLTRPLRIGACHELDDSLARLLVGMSWKRTEEYVRARVLELLPPDEQEARRAAALDRRHVTIGESADGVTQLDAVVDAADGILLKAQVARFANILLEGGQRGTLDARRAMALGILANPARALQLAQAALTDELPDDPDEFEECFRAGQPGHTCGSVTVEPERLLPRAELVVHLTDATLAEGEGLARTSIGPMLVEWAQQLLGRQRVSLRPVVDADRVAASDAYQVPDAMRQAVELRNPTDVFPWSSRSSRRCDLDHTVPFTRGIPGQTRPGNLGPLSRKAHRAKTHGGWRLEQPSAGVFVWTSPLGQRFLVTRSHTIPLDPLGRQPVLLQAA